MLELGQLALAVAAFAVLGIRSAIISSRITAALNERLPAAERRYPLSSWGASTLRRQFEAQDPKNRLIRQWKWTTRAMMITFALAALTILFRV